MRADIGSSDRFQQQVIAELGSRNILVSASAGAGKTKVLVTRIMKRVIDDGVDLERIIALTFTAAAAEEMKNRLAEELHRMRGMAETEEEKAYIEKQITSLITANITTIDSYCLNIIKKYYNVIGLDPATTENILSAGRNELLQRQAFESALHDLNAEDHDGLMKLMTWFSQRSEDFDSLYSIISTIRAHADTSVDPDAWYEKAASMYIPFRSVRQLPEELQAAWYAMLEELCREIRDALTSASGRLELIGSDDKMTSGMLNEAMNYVQDCLQLLAGHDYEGMRFKLHELAGVKIVKAKDPLLNEYRDLIFARIDQLLSICYPEEVFASRSERQSEIAALLVRAARLTSRHFDDLKKERSCLNFADMERYALNILQANDGTVARRINAGIDEILVDEFQDTSVLQDMIIRLVARDKLIFRVGDVKQSIYRFRQARPQLMRDLMADDRNKTFTLRYNYRSNEQIIRFTNVLFDRLLNIEGTRDSYLRDDHVTAGLDRQKTGSEARTELVLLEKPEAELTAKGSRRAMRSGEAKYIKSAWIASRIHEMMAEDPSLTYHDFAVLTRSHAEQLALRSQFDRFRIPYDIDAREGFYRSDLCLDILAMLKYMQDPDDELSLLSILSGPMYRFSDEQLALTVIGKNRKLCRAVREYYPEIPARFAAFRRTAESMGPLALLQEIMRADVGGKPFYEVLTRKDQANFDYLFDKVTNSDILTAAELADEIEAGSDEQSSEAVTSGRDDDVVTVTTIHHSKGLQYRIVFLWGTSANRARSSAAKVMADDTLMLGFHDVDPDTRIILPTIQRLCIEYRDGREDLEEFSRLLYVAVTRAEERLIIVDDAAAAVDTQKQIGISALKNRKGITGLITAAMNHEEGLNEDGLLKVHTICFDEDSLLYGNPDDVLARDSEIPRWDAEVSPLPVIQTPSSLERPAKAETVFTLPPLNESRRGASYGTMMHELLAALPDDVPWTMDLLHRYADPSLPEGALQSVIAFYESDLYQRSLDMDIHKEYPFYYEDEAMRINGIMDFAAIGSEHIILIDFKTDRASEDEIRAMYAPQLEAYRKVLAHFYPHHQIEAYAWSLHHNTAIEMK